MNDTHGLHGHVQIFLKDKKTGKKTLHFEKDNVISISGSQWIFEKMFNLYLDSEHNNPSVLPKKDTNVTIPDLNAQNIQIGIDPSEYTTMPEDISQNHFIQGFMVGNGGGGEDSITAKNTDYSFINLRNPIPFQQTDTKLSPTIAGKYLGKMRLGTASTNANFYIKKFDSRPHIVHSWWMENQKWSYIDPVVPEDLGPVAPNGSPKTGRIESYVECEMSISEDDCKSYYQHEGSSETPVVNEIGLVAFDTLPGQRGMLETVYNDQITEFLKMMFDGSRRSEADKMMMINYATSIYDAITNTLGSVVPSSNISEFINTLSMISSETETFEPEDYHDALSSEENIEAKAYYSGNNHFEYVEDKFLDHIQNDTEFADLTTDEAQRAKLITYYTFNSIPLQTDIDIIFLYRIYAN